MEFIKEYTTYIEAELNQLQLPATPQKLYDPIRYFLTIGGKRMRPMLTLLGAELFGLKREEAIKAALAIETFHNFTLIHDDIMDDAPLRRGFTTVHEKWDQTTAILSGDALMIKSYQLLQEQSGDLRALLSVYNKVALEVCEGQQMDMDFETASSITIEQYIEMIRLKTSVLLGGALELSAIIAEASQADRTHIYNFGVSVGIAFQIQDDILDLYADPEKFGKQVGGDVISNKKTLLYLVALQNANPKQTEALQILSSEQDLEKKIRETILVFDEIGAREICLEYVTKFFTDATKSMDSIALDSNNKQKLMQLSQFLLNREV